MYTLVLVEDDFQIRNGLNRFFPWNQLGFDLVCCLENGQKALDYLQINRVDIVLTDIRMPVMDGITLAEKLRRMYPDIYIVFISAYRDFDYACRAIELGVKNYIVKSTKYDDLITIFTQIKAQMDQKDAAVIPKEPSPGEIEVDNRAIQQVVKMINANLAEASLQQLASSVNLSTVYLSRLFKKKTGVNFVDYLTEKKMEKSRSLLVDTEYSIAKISEIVGYSNEKNFSRAFKRYYGVSPFDYRNLV